MSLRALRTSMNDDKQKRLEEAGWKVGDAYEFLGLSSEEAEQVGDRVRLGDEEDEAREKE